MLKNYRFCLLCGIAAAVIALTTRAPGSQRPRGPRNKVWVAINAPAR